MAASKGDATLKSEVQALNKSLPPGKFCMLFCRLRF